MAGTGTRFLHEHGRQLALGNLSFLQGLGAGEARIAAFGEPGIVEVLHRRCVVLVYANASAKYQKFCGPLAASPRTFDHEGIGSARPNGEPK